jgi:hypothetical protein
MSNRDRIDRMRAEADAAQREREQKRKEAGDKPARSRAGKAAKPAGRMKIVWAVKDPAGKIVKTFPYPLKAAAEADAKERTGETGREHMVRPEKVPMED